MQSKLFGCGALSHAFSQFSNNNLHSYCQMIYCLGMLRHLFRAINLNLVKMIHSSYLEQLLASVVNSSFFAFFLSDVGALMDGFHYADRAGEFVGFKRF